LTVLENGVKVSVRTPGQGKGQGKQQQ